MKLDRKNEEYQKIRQDRAEERQEADKTGSTADSFTAYASKYWKE
jgi:hypothetical protein